MVAEDAYYDVRAKIRSSLPVFDKTFKEIWKLAMEDEARKVERGEMSEARLKWLHSRSALYFLPFFGNKTITSINQRTVHDYWQHRMDFWKQPDAEAIKKKFRAVNPALNPKGTTLVLEQRVLEMVFKKAVAMNYVSEIGRPSTLPPVKHEKKRRPALLMEQWTKMSDFMRTYMLERGPGVNDDNRRARTLLYYYCTTVVSTGMRVSDMRNMKWENMHHHIGIDGAKAALFQVYGKNNYRDVIAKPELFEVLKQWREHPLNKFKEDTDYIFSHRTGGPFDDLRDMFETMKKNAELTDEFKGIGEDYLGDNITLYSLRHTYASFQIMFCETSYEDLAKNMGNSPKIIFEHYDHVRSSDIAKRLSKVIHQLSNEKLIDETPQKIGEQVLTQNLFADVIPPSKKAWKDVLLNKISKEEFAEASGRKEAS